MRSLPFLALAALLAAPAVSAQTIGVKAGVQAANVSIDEDDVALVPGEEKKARLGIVAGLTADLPITPSIALRPEVLYTQKGYQVTSEDNGVDGSATARIDYFEVPLLLAYNVVQPNGLAFSIEAGPTLAYKLSSGIGCDADGALGEAFCDRQEIGDGNGDDGIKDFDFGGAIGATVGSGPFGVGVRYTQGFIDIGKNAGEVDGARNSTFAATLHYRFGAR